MGGQRKDLPGGAAKRERRRRPRWGRAGVAAVLVAALAAAAFAMLRPAVQADLRPLAHQNILLVTIDTLRADALGAYGGRAPAPARDPLANEGVRFDFPQAPAMGTAPDHARLLAGPVPVP